MHTELMDAASRFLPRGTARFWTAVMLMPGRRMRIRASQAPVMARAVRSTIDAAGRRIAVYRWGSGERRILLVHGWSGRAAQFADLVSRLSVDATVVAFDAPAHGETRGVTADIGMWIEAIRALDAEYGFDLVIGHSFGGLAALRARRAGLVGGKVVSISAPPSTDAVTQAFAVQARLSAAVSELITGSFARRLGPVMSAIASGPDAGPGAAADAEALVIHDRSDRVVPVGAAQAIEAWWPGVSGVVLTDGRGHNGILADPDVVDAIASFATEPARAA